MHKIIKAIPSDAKQLAQMIPKAFLVAHGSAGSATEMGNYIFQNFSPENLVKEIANPKFEYHLLYYQNQLVGFSKIIFNTAFQNISKEGNTKMERLYLLPEYHGLGLAKKLFDFNVQLAKENNQKGIWLLVWIKNLRAIRFYEKMGFEKVGDYDFEVSKTNYQPNYILRLTI
jgi:ribosomal protein S18 acetylase RimI-like enzyme